MTTLPPGLADAVERAGVLATRFRAAGHRLYLVGGVVRDHLLGRPRGEQDLDATTAARPEEIKKIVAPVADAVWTQGERFGTIGCRVDGAVYEITTHRAESYTPGSRKPSVVFGDDIVDDLARRDFTVNAMAVDTADGTLVDPFGGRDDLDAGVLRTPLDPTISFSEDPLRMLRAARFVAGHGLAPAPALVAAMRALAPRLGIVSVERIRDELSKLLLLDDPGPGLVLLASTGVAAEAIPEAAGWDPATAAAQGAHVAAVAPDQALCWALLLAPDDGRLDRGRLRKMKFPNDLAAQIAYLAARLAPERLAEPWDGSPPALRRAAVAAHRVGRRVEDTLAAVRSLREAAGLGTEDVDTAAETLATLRASEPDLDDPRLPLTGDDVCALLGIEPGPAVGAALDVVRRHRLEHGPMDRATAEALLRPAP